MVKNGGYVISQREDMWEGIAVVVQWGEACCCRRAKQEERQTLGSDEIFEILFLDDIII